MSNIKKAVIPCGGAGTRFLPITKAVAKEILPLIDTPVLGHIVTEAVDSGITDILIIYAPGKEAIKNYFSPNKDLLKRLRDKGNSAYADMLEKITSSAKFSFAIQEKPLGSGDALLYAEKFTSNDPFCLAFGDDLIYAADPVMGQMISAYSKAKKSLLGVQTIEGPDISKYGVVDTKGAVLDGNRVVSAHDIIEKPEFNNAPSKLAALGRYVLEPNIYPLIKNLKPAKDGELQLTDAFRILCAKGMMSAYDFIGKRYDMGDKFGASVAMVDYALRSNEFGARFKDYLKEFVKTL